MPRPIKHDPYNGFKDDRERRRALNVRAMSYAVALVAISTVETNLMEKIQWLIRLFS